VSLLVRLGGVGPATASGVLSAHSSEVYPFFDELVAGQMPGLGEVAFTAPFYYRYAEMLRARAMELNKACEHRKWTVNDVGQALWAVSGGKVVLASKR
jgi:hypothetical protein